MRTDRNARLAIAVVFAAVTCSAQETLPSRSYGPTRSSKAWVETSRGRVAVDDGIVWKGVKVYLSLTWDLVATDDATGKTLWSDPVGAFWNEIGVKEVETAGAKAWAVELRPGPRSDGTGDLRQYHDLRTGKRLLDRETAPSGNVLRLDPQWSGRWSDVAAPVRRMVGSEADWKALVVDPMFGSLKDPPKLGTVDFAKNVALVIASGETWNCNGLDATAWEDDRRILVRLNEQTFQTEGPDGGGQRVRPWGVFVLPKREPFKSVIVERNVQGLIGGPAIWKELVRFDALGEGKSATPQRARTR
jgi:hypothetical protein